MNRVCDYISHSDDCCFFSIVFPTLSRYQIPRASPSIGHIALKFKYAIRFFSTACVSIFFFFHFSRIHLSMHRHHTHISLNYHITDACL